MNRIGKIIGRVQRVFFLLRSFNLVIHCDVKSDHFETLWPFAVRHVGIPVESRINPNLFSIRYLVLPIPRFFPGETLVFHLRLLLSYKTTQSTCSTH